VETFKRSTTYSYITYYVIYCICVCVICPKQKMFCFGQKFVIFCLVNIFHDKIRSFWACFSLPRNIGQNELLRVIVIFVCMRGALQNSYFFQYVVVYLVAISLMVLSWSLLLILKRDLQGMSTLGRFRSSPSWKVCSSYCSDRGSKFIRFLWKGIRVSDFKYLRWCFLHWIL